MNCRGFVGQRWFARTLGAILVVTTSHPARVSGSNDTAVAIVDTQAAPFLANRALPATKLVGGLDLAVTERAQETVDVVVAYDSVEAALADTPEPSDDAPLVDAADVESVDDDSAPTRRASRALSHLPFRSVRVLASELPTLAARSNIRYITPDSAVLGASAVARQTARVPGSLGAPLSANAGYTGQGVTVAVVDTGVAAHPDFYSLAGQFNFVGGTNGAPMSKTDGFGHGTHVAGMIGSTGSHSSSAKYQGVATSARIVGLRVLDSQGRGQMSDVLASLDWILRVGIPQYNVRVANLSLGKGVETVQAQDPLVQAVDALWDAGVVVVVSAGNHGESGHFTISSPGNSRKVITVGSVSDNGTGGIYDDYVSTFSSRGPTLFDHVLKPDVLAPGNRIMAPYAEGSTIGTLVTPDRIKCGHSYVTSCSTRYLRLSGTSMAAGLVSGAVARMLHKDPSLTPSTVKARLMKTARKVWGDPTTTGAGVLDVDAAMNATGQISVKALSPLMQLSSNGAVAYVQDTSALWGGTQWANGYLWADGFLWTNASPLGANGYLWSESYLWSNSFLWANSFLWSNGFLWSDAVAPASVDAEDPGEAEAE